MPSHKLPDPRAVLDFWFGDGLALGWPSASRQTLWFGGGADQDAVIRRRFGPLVERALDQGLPDWQHTPTDRLALVILLDQFTRNIHRGRARAFAGDGLAQQLVQESRSLGHDLQLPTVGRVFFYMPLMHAEDRALQADCVACFTALHASAPPELRETLAGNLHFANEHRDTVERFGRFPHRNAALGRTSTPEEAAFLEHGPRYGQ
jgi:uncharacterized protein (DUF924 family)